MRTKGMSQSMSIAEKETWNANTGLTLTVLALKTRLLTTCHPGTPGRSERLFMSILSILNSSGMNSNGGAGNEKAS